MRNGFPMCGLISACFFLVGAIQQVAFSQSNLANSDGKSNHFDVRSYSNGPSAKSVLQLCETVRAELQRVWQADSKCEKWEPRCEIVLHPNRQSYQNVVAGDFSSFGSSLIQLDAGKIVARRIDLLVDQDGSLSALPHELTHVVLADHFKGRQPPLWMDEGIAMLADTREKQLLHQRDCIEAMTTGRAIPLKDLMQLEQFSSAEQVPAFYGQSLTLVRMLSEQGKPQTVVHFTIDALDLGVERALQKHYAIQNLHELEKRWKVAVDVRATVSPQSAAIVNVRFQP